MRDNTDQESAALRSEPDQAGDDQAIAVLPDGANSERPTAGFDPTPYLRQLRGRGGGQDYLDVKWRLVWLRREHPDAEILTEHVQLESTLAIFKATVTLPTGGKATGYGSETASDFGDFIEKAETKAIGRALNALGYGAQFGERNEDEPDPTPPPRPAARPASAPAAAAPHRASPPAAAAPRPAPAAIPNDPDPVAASPVTLPADRDPGPAENSPVPTARRKPPAAPPAASPSPGATPPDDEANLADYSWSAFWPWARELGLNGPKPVEALIGRSAAGLTPAELRDLILAAREK